MVLFSLVAILIGMNEHMHARTHTRTHTCSHTHTHTRVYAGGDLVPSTPNSTQYNITSADLSKLHSELTASIRSTLSIDVHHHVESHMNEVKWYTCGPCCNVFYYVMCVYRW